MKRRRFLASAFAAAVASAGGASLAGAADAEVGAVRIRPSGKWMGMRRLFEVQCRSGHSCLREWDALVSFMREIDDSARMAFANDYLNAAPYRSDNSVYQVSDHWATPLDFLANGADCEDFAAAKYLALAASGLPESRLRVLIVRSDSWREAHAVAAMQGKGGWYILDNNAPGPIRAGSGLGFQTLYALSGEDRWMCLGGARICSVM